MKSLWHIIKYLIGILINSFFESSFIGLATIPSSNANIGEAYFFSCVVVERSVLANVNSTSI